ncbi:MAG: DHA2 family efflux MFS transporter permease subunit [Propionibacteriaceae bacterium]|jgi:EmrB/QacA subfamily drug resistance transporter|nr:DHA2 family efflux MFS transporter permease subunit [Propionibacteriaceae bacterium]
MVKKQRITVAVLVAGAFVSVLCQTLLNPALPAIMAELRVSATTAQWLISGFTLVNALVIPVTAFLMDRFSTRKLFMSIFGLFVAGSLLAGWGANFALVLAGRLLTAVCAGVLMPMSITIMMLVFPRERRGAAMGLFTLVTMFAPAIGPVVSGILTDSVGWHLMFFIMAFLALVILVLGGLWLTDVGELTRPKLDKLSLALCSIGLFALLYGLSEVGNQPVAGVLTIAFGAAVLVFFARRQLHMDTPVLQLRVLADKQFLTGTIVAMLVSASLTAAAVTLPLYIQNVRGMSATISGIVMMPGAVMGAIVGYFAGNLHDRFGSRYLTISGVSLLMIGSLGMALFGDDTPLWFIITTFCVRSVGLMLANTPINLWAIEKLGNKLLSHGNAVSSTLRMIAATFGTAVMVTVMSLFHGSSGSELTGIVAAYWVSFGIAVLCVVIVVVRVWDKKKGPAQVAEFDLDQAMRTPPYTIESTASLADVIDKLIEYKTSGISVVDKEGNLVGLITDGRLLRYLGRHDARVVTDGFSAVLPDDKDFRAKADELLQANIMDVAIRHPISVDRSTELPEICRLFAERKLNKLPVTQDGQVVGTISRGDVMRYLMGLVRAA